MIEAYKIYDAVTNLIRADKRGKSLSIDEFNRLAVAVNQRVFAKMYDNFETTTENIGTLAGFKVIDHAIALGGATCSLPADYYEMIGKPRILDGASTRRCDLVSQLELDERTDDYLTQPTARHPVYTLGEMDVTDNLILHVYPTTIAGNITIDYLREPAEPYLDYMVLDSTLVSTYMVAGAMAVNIPSGYTYRDGTTGGVAVFKNSATVEWEWTTGEMSLILALFAELIGIQLPDQFLTQIGNAEELKNTQ
jgi:hypothetical protein